MLSNIYMDNFELSFNLKLHQLNYKIITCTNDLLKINLIEEYKTLISEQIKTEIAIYKMVNRII